MMALSQRLLGGSGVVIRRVISLLIWVTSLVTLLITLLITTHEPSSELDLLPSWFEVFLPSSQDPLATLNTRTLNPETLIPKS